MDTFDLLHARASGSSDNRTVALVLGGGGMRATWQVAALAELADSPLGEHIDMVVGSSAGAMNGCYFAAGQADDAVRVYTDELTSRRFVNPARVWKIMDIDWLVDDVLSRRVPLDLDALRSNHARVLVALTSLHHAGNAHVVDQHHPELMQALRATAALPVLYGRAPAVGESRFMDGGLAAPIPWREALEEGATDLLILSCSAIGERWRAATGPANWFLAGWCHLRSPQAGLAVYRLCGTRFDAAMEVAEGHAPINATVTTLFPSRPESLCARTTTKRASLARTAAAGRADMRDAIQQNSSR